LGRLNCPSATQKTTHLVKSASGHALEMKYKLPNAKICQNKVCIPHFFFLVKNQLYPPIILGTPFINGIYPFTSIDSKGFSATYKDNEITYSFVTDLVTRDINALIDNNFSITNIAMIDSGADVSCIQEGLVSTKYFKKTTHLVKSASRHALDIMYKLTNATIFQNKVFSPHFLFLVKNQLYLPIILGTPFINNIYPFTCINSKGFSATYKDNEITYSFVTDPVTRDINALINMKQNHMDSLQLELFSMNIFDSL